MFSGYFTYVWVWVSVKSGLSHISVSLKSVGTYFWVYVGISGCVDSEDVIVGIGDGVGVDLVVCVCAKAFSLWV